MNSPLDIPFLPLAPFSLAFTALRDSIRESLKPQLEPLPPFFRDTQVALNLRMYYFNRDNHVAPPRSDNEALTLGGSLAYQSGWLAHLFRLGVEGFGSQTLAPRVGMARCCSCQARKVTQPLGRAYGELEIRRVHRHPVSSIY